MVQILLFWQDYILSSGIICHQDQFGEVTLQCNVVSCEAIILRESVKMDAIVACRRVALSPHLSSELSIERRANLSPQSLDHIFPFRIIKPVARDNHDAIIVRLQRSKERRIQ